MGAEEGGEVRKIILCLGLLFPLHAFSQTGNAVPIVAGCGKFVQASSDLSIYKTLGVVDAVFEGRCVGAIKAARTNFGMIHDLRKSNGNISVQVALDNQFGPDVCVPDNIPDHSVAQKVIDFAASNSALMNMPPEDFVMLAIVKSFPCH